MQSVAVERHVIGDEWGRRFPQGCVICWTENLYRLIRCVVNMRRRPLLASLSASIAASVAGCLGALQNDTIGCADVELDGHVQWRYDACNSGHARGMTAPTAEPTLERIYRGGSGPPLTKHETLFSGSLAADISGSTRWEADGSAAALYENTVLGTGSAIDGFWAISTEHGREQWQADLSESHRVSNISIHGDRAYYCTTTGVLCVDLEAQTEAWVADLDAEYPYLLTGGDWYAPAVTGSHVFVLSNIFDSDRNWDDHPRKLYALDPETGDVDWTIDLEPDDQWVISAPIAGDGFVFVMTSVSDDATDDRLVRVTAVDPNARDIAWRRTLTVHTGNTMPALGDGRLYVSHGRGVDGPAKLAALDTDDGSMVWDAEQETSIVIPTIADEIVITIDSSRIWGLDLATGDPIWKMNWYEAVLEEPHVEKGLRAVSEIIPVVHDDRIFLYIGEDMVAEFQ